VLEEAILSRLDEPRCVTLDDLLLSDDRDLADENGEGGDAFFEFDPLVNRVPWFVQPEQFDAAFDWFGATILKTLRLFSSHPIPIGIAPNRLASKFTNKPRCFWVGGAAALTYNGTGPAGFVESDIPFDWSDSVKIYLTLNGSFSPQAWRQVRGVIPVLLRSLSLSFTLAWNECGVGPTKVGLPVVFEEGLADRLRFISRCLDVYYRPPSKGDSFQRRLRNALMMLVEADRQTHDAIGLSLCFSALEAMLVDSKSSIVATLSENLAALLEPVAANRPRAVKVVAELYDTRSRVLHGDSLDFDKTDDARLLAAAVLKALMEREDFIRRLGDKTEVPRELFAELKESRLSGRQVIGVADSEATSLWRGPPAAPTTSQ
jgi:hypothetical protein